MKKIIILIAVVFCIMLVGCTSTEQTGNESLPKESMSSESIYGDGLAIKSVVKTSYDTGYKIVAQYAISDKDYKMYNDILDALNSDYSKSEDEILAALTGKYGMSVSELKKFMQNNMKDAIDRDNGKTIGENTITNAQLIECGQKVIWSTIDNTDVDVPNSPLKWEISKTGLRYVLKTSFDAGGSTGNNAIIKIEFNADYSEFTLFQLKYNDVNVDL